MRKKFFLAGFVILFFLLCSAQLSLPAEESLFTPAVASSPLVQKAFSFLEKNREKIIKEWILLTENQAPSGRESKRAEYVKNRLS